MRRWIPTMSLLFLLGIGTGIGIDRATHKPVAPRPSMLPSQINFSPARTVVVPSIQSGVGVVEAEALIRKAKLTPVVRSVNTSGRPPFTFLHQVPGGGTVVLEGTAVTLFAL
jgi:hypothetical protein